MKNQGLVSVIIPVYNVEKYLPQCLESVLSQSYQKLELILVDDGSTDGSGEICDVYAEQDSRIKVLHCENCGAAAARNTGINVAQGEFVYFLDSDDWLAEDAIKTLRECAVAEMADVVFFDAYTVDDEQGVQTSSNYLRKKQYPSQSGGEMLRELIINKEFRVSPCLIFSRRDLLELEDLRFVEGIMYEDMIFAYQIFSVAKRIAQVKKALYYRRYRNNSVMTTKKSMRNMKSACVVYNEVRAFAMHHKKINEKATQEYIVRCAFNVLNVYTNISRKDKKELEQTYKSVKQQILMDKAYENKALYMRCFGRVPWFLYKAYEKSLGKVLKGRK